MPSMKPVSRTKEEARAAYNRLSRWYDAVSGSTEKKYRDIGLRMLDAQPGEHILEIGFGTGHCLVTLAEAVTASGQVSGIDISDGMLAITRQRLAAAGLADRAALHLGDAAQLPFPPRSFDAVFMSFTLELFDTPEIPRVLDQCRAVLKPGGRICLVTMAKNERDSLPVRIYEWFHDRMPAAIDCRPIFAQSALRQAGFQICRTEALLMWGLPVEIILAANP
jgi:ubiquinone/menaquinone biosynthesis C-methylase UbiE